MDKAHQIFLELKLELLKLFLIQASLNGSLMFLLIYIVGWIFSLPLLIPGLLLSGAYVIGFCVYEMRKVDYSYIEEKEPELRDVLRTVYDNLEEQGMMLKALVEDLAMRMHNVRPANFFNSKQAFLKLLAVALIAILFPLATSFRVDLYHVQEQIGDFTSLFPQLKEPETPGQVFEDIEFSSTDDIYGDPSVALLGDEELLLTIATSLGSIDFTKPQEASSRKFTDQEIEEEIVATTDATYEEKIAKNKQKIVQEYFRQIQT